MVRIKNAVASRKRKKRVLKQAKGYFLQRSKRYQQADRTVVRAEAFSYRDRKVKKRDFRSLWIIRISAACKEMGLTYSRLMSGLKKAQVTINRKMLAEMAVSSPSAFKRLVEVAQAALPAKA